MTPSQLRAEAARLRARAASLETAAARLRVIAGTIRDLLSGLVARSRAVWAGPAADDFEQRADAADRDVKTQAAHLVDAAGGFDVEARGLRGRAAALEAEATAAEAAAAAAAASAVEASAIPADVE